MEDTPTRVSKAMRVMRIIWEISKEKGRDPPKASIDEIERYLNDASNASEDNGWNWLGWHYLDAKRRRKNICLF